MFRKIYSLLSSRKYASKYFLKKLLEQMYLARPTEALGIDSKNSAQNPPAKLSDVVFIAPTELLTF